MADKYTFSRFINNLSKFIDEPARVYMSTSGGGAYNPATEIREYIFQVHGEGGMRLLDHEDNYKVVYEYTWGSTSAERWGISYYDSVSDSFIQHQPTGKWGSSTDYIVDDACLYSRNEEKEYIYKVGHNDGVFYWDPDDPTNIIHIVVGEPSGPYLRRRKCLAVFDGYIWVGGMHSSGTDRAGIMRSTTGNNRDFWTYWLWNDHVPPSDPKYNTFYVWSISKLDDHIFWGTSLGQIWGDINGGNSCIFDFRPGDTTNNPIKGLVKFRTHYVASSKYEIAISSDGLNWTQQPVPADLKQIHKVLVLDDVLFLLGQNTSNHPMVWNTVNYVDWYPFFEVTTQTHWYVYDMLFDGSYFWISDKTSVRLLQSTKM